MPELSEHHAEWAPSNFPAWGLCPQFESDPVSGKDAKAGSKLHKTLYYVLMGQKPPMNTSTQKTIGNAVKVVRELEDDYGSGVYEEKIHGSLVNQTLRPIETYGTPDVLMADLGELAIYDMKSGNYTTELANAYHDQLRVYASLKAEALSLAPFCKVRLTVHFPRENEVLNEFTTVEQCQARINKVIGQRVMRTEFPRKPCHFCKYCAIRDKCPVYQEDILVKAPGPVLDGRKITFPERNPNDQGPLAPIKLTNRELEGEYIDVMSLRDKEAIIKQEILRRHRNGVVFNRVHVRTHKGVHGPVTRVTIKT